MGRISLQTTDVLYIDVRPLMKKPKARSNALFITCASLLLACSQTNTSQTSTTTSPGNSNAIPIGIGVAEKNSNVALLGQEQVAGAKIAEKYFKDKGGVNEARIKLV